MGARARLIEHTIVKGTSLEKAAVMSVMTTVATMMMMMMMEYETRTS